MLRATSFGATEDTEAPQILWEEDGLTYFRVRRRDADHFNCLCVIPTDEESRPEVIDRLTREFELRESLGSTWAAPPLELVLTQGKTMLVLESPRGRPLHDHIDGMMDVERFLQLGIAIAQSICLLHAGGIVHRNIKPSHLLVDDDTGVVRLTGFGLASLLSRDPEIRSAPQFIAGTLPYMAPEQTGRMNRGVDFRADLYSFGIILYQALTGRLPFQAADPMGWIHCHIAKMPPPPHQIIESIPHHVSAIIMRLLAKSPEDRYQTAAGVQDDLLKCLVAWKERQSLQDVELGRYDIDDRLSIPATLYARAPQLAELRSASSRVAQTGTPELVLITGSAGIGKSALVRELSRSQHLSNGFFAEGKFDQYKHDIPYAALAPAFQSLVRQLLNKSEEDLSTWRRELSVALGSNGQLMVALIPQLALVIGEQPPVPPVGPTEARARFHSVFQNLLRVFSSKEHPLTIFIDDLQWLDLATLDFLKHLTTKPGTDYLLIVCAYRDDEITSVHPLSNMLDSIQESGVSVSKLQLPSLTAGEVLILLRDTLGGGYTDDVHALADLVREKTGGNPFFVRQFIVELAVDELITFDRSSLIWRWNLDGIRSRNISDNVVDLLAGKLDRLPIETRDALGHLACLGISAEFTTLLAITELSEQELLSSLQIAIDSGLLVRTEGSISLIHDRIHEAAYAMVAGDHRASIHLKNARAIASSTKHEDLYDRIFLLVDQFNRANAVLDSAAERLEIAGYNLIAGKRAATATAYSSALHYFSCGRALLPADSWSTHRDLTFNLEWLQAESEFVTGDLRAAERRLAIIALEECTTSQQTQTVCLQLLVLFTSGQYDKAIAIGLDWLERHETPLPRRPTHEDVQREYEHMLGTLKRSSIEQFGELAPMAAPVHLATISVLNELYPAAVTSENTSTALADLVILRMTNLCLANGNCDASSVAYSALSLFLGSRFGDYETSFRFARLACNLADRGGSDRSKARAYSQAASFAMPWFIPFRECRAMLAQAFALGKATGDTAFAVYTLRHLLTNLLVSGVPLDEVQQRSEEALLYVRSAGFGAIAERFVGHRWLTGALRGESTDVTVNDDWARQNVTGQRGLAQLVSYHWIFKLQERFLANDYEAAIEAASFVEPIRWAMLSGLELMIYELYASLSYAAMAENPSDLRQGEYVQAFKKHAHRVGEHSIGCLDNFADCRSLVFAELARIEGRDLDAQHLYEEAIQLAHKSGTLHIEGLSCELAARFYRSRNFERVSIVYARDAKSCFRRWGATVKVRHLEQLYPSLNGEQHAPKSTSTILAPIEHLDLATVIKVSQAVSREIVLDNLVATLVRLAVEYAGADRGLLILSRGKTHLIEAEASITNGSLDVVFHKAAITAERLSETMFHYVVRTRESALVQDAASDQSFQPDVYTSTHDVRSILCMPLLNQSRLLGVLYLENSLIPNVFTPSRVAVLELLASAAVISLENSRLYADLQEREARMRRLVDSNIIGIFIWGTDGIITETNDAFLNIIGHERSDFGSRDIHWRDLTPTEWVAKDEERLRSLNRSGMVTPYEGELLRKNGTRVSVLIGAALFDEAPTQGVAYVLDLTARNNAEQAARDSDRQYHELQLQLVHANRVATMGQLSASIAHELNQPLSGIMTNAGTCLSMLADKPPNVGGASETARRTIRDAQRATDVITRLRSLFSNNDSHTEILDLSEVAQEVLDLYSSELRKEGILVHRDLSNDLPDILGDRIQLQQVILNLLQNAFDAMSSLTSDRKHLVIRTARDREYQIILSVEDSGTGFDPSNIERLFDPFYTTKSKGMGIGLSVCRSIIERHSGRLWASSTPGAGATFTFSLVAQAH
ncbi:AAA family ATPase [Tardiphaga sp. 862_B3_N4_1]|uniref:AAA family ATPase n=1 Tax=Tardiphaga sp. 862_B3_N4_1 TaxID=3240764 RepID=UPI003F217051